jgi:hypothetical protein
LDDKGAIISAVGIRPGRTVRYRFREARFQCRGCAWITDAQPHLLLEICAWRERQSEQSRDDEN